MAVPKGCMTEIEDQCDQQTEVIAQETCNRNWGECSAPKIKRKKEALKKYLEVGLTTSLQRDVVEDAVKTITFALTACHTL